MRSVVGAFFQNAVMLTPVQGWRRSVRRSMWCWLRDKDDPLTVLRIRVPMGYQAVLKGGKDAIRTHAFSEGMHYVQQMNVSSHAAASSSSLTSLAVTMGGVLRNRSPSCA